MKGKTIVYRFYNMGAGKYGEPWALCEKHKDKITTPESCILEKIGENSDVFCNQCK